MANRCLLAATRIGHSLSSPWSVSFFIPTSASLVFPKRYMHGRVIWKWRNDDGRAWGEQLISHFVRWLRRISNHTDAANKVYFTNSYSQPFNPPSCFKLNEEWRDEIFLCEFNVNLNFNVLSRIHALATIYSSFLNSLSSNYMYNDAYNSDSFVRIQYKFELSGYLTRWKFLQRLWKNQIERLFPVVSLQTFLHRTLWDSGWR